MKKNVKYYKIKAIYPIKILFFVLLCVISQSVSSQQFNVLEEYEELIGPKFKDTQGNLWFIKLNEDIRTFTIVSYNNGELNDYNISEKYCPDMVAGYVCSGQAMQYQLSMYEDNQSRVYVNAPEKIYCMENGTIVDEFKKDESEYLKYYYQDSNNKLLFLLAVDEILKTIVAFDGESFKREQLPIKKQITYSFQNDKGEIWIGNKDELVLILEKDSVKTSLTEEENAFYLSYKAIDLNLKNKDLAKVFNFMFNEVLKLDEKEKIINILDFSNGLYIYTNKAIYSKLNSESKWKKHEVNPEWQKLYVDDPWIEVTNDGQLWFSAKNNNGIFKFDGNKFEYYNEDRGLGENFIKRIIIDSKDRVYAFHKKSISLFSNNKWSNYGKNENVIVSNTAYSIMIDKYETGESVHFVQIRSMPVGIPKVNIISFIDNKWETRKFEISKSIKVFNNENLILLKTGSAELLVFNETGMTRMESTALAGADQKFFLGGLTIDKDSNYWACGVSKEDSKVRAIKFRIE